MNTHVCLPCSLNLALAASCLLVISGPLNTTAAEGKAKAPAESQPPPRLTERDYLVEELKITEEQLQREEKLAETGRSSPERLASAKRSLISMRRQLAAYDERTKRLTPEQQAERQRRTDENKRLQEERDQRASELKQELLPVLLAIAQEDKDARVRQTAVSSMNRLRMDSSIEPLGQVVLKDTDLNVRSTALATVGEFRNEQSLDTLLKLYKQLPDTETSLKLNLLRYLQISQREYQPDGVSYNITHVTPTNVVPMLAEIVSNSPVRDLRRSALQTLSSVAGERTTEVLVELYEQCGDNEFKQMIVQFLGGRGDSQAMRKLLDIARSDSDSRSRQIAVELLGGMPFGQNQPRAGVPMRAVPPGLPPSPR